MHGDVASTVPDKTPSGYERTGRIHDLCEAVAARLRTCSIIQDKGIRVLPEYAGDMFNQLAGVLNKRLSVLIVVGLDDGGINALQRGEGVYLKDIGIKVSCFESVLLNQSSTGTKVSALALAELSLVKLHAWMPEAEDVAAPQPIYMREEKTLILDADKSKPEQGLVCYTTRFTCAGCAKCDCEEEA